MSLKLLIRFYLLCFLVSEKSAENLRLQGDGNPENCAAGMGQTAEERPDARECGVARGRPDAECRV
jgi:hypothetical protein